MGHFGEKPAMIDLQALSASELFDLFSKVMPNCGVASSSAAATTRSQTMPSSWLQARWDFRLLIRQPRATTPWIAKGNGTKSKCGG